jgi:hypothetical protein
MQIKDPKADNEIREFAEMDGNKIYIARDVNDSLNLLSMHTIDKAIISVKNLKDTSILKYLNQFHPNIQVLIVANETFNDVFSIFQKVSFLPVNEPLTFSDLRKKLYLEHNPC